MSLLADALDYFNNVDDDEALRLYEQSNAITARVEGSLSVNVAAGEETFAIMYYNRAKRARAANDLDREITNLELAPPHYLGAARIYRAANHMTSADRIEQFIVDVEEKLQECRIEREEEAATRG